MWSVRVARSAQRAIQTQTRNRQSIRHITSHTNVLLTSVPSYRPSRTTPPRSVDESIETTVPIETNPDSAIHVDNSPNLENDPRASNIEDLRRQYGLMDPASPEFKYKRTASSRFLSIGFLIALPLGLYHLSMTVREFVDSQIESLRNAYTARFPEQTRKDQTKKSPFEQVKAEGKTQTQPATKAATPATTTTDAKPAVASTVGASTTDTSKNDDDRRIGDAVELATILELLQLCSALIEVERLERTAAKQFNQGIDAVASSTVQFSAELPADAAMRAIKELVIQLQLPPLPSPPRWARPPTTAAEAQERLEKLESFRAEYEVAVANAVVQLKNTMREDLSPVLQKIYAQAREQFDSQLPERLRRAKIATSNALESSSLVELAEISRDITAKKAKEWSTILVNELDKQKRHLEQAMNDVLHKQEKKLDKEYDPSVTEQLAKLNAQRLEIQRLEKELSRKKSIEKEGERVHALTSLLIKMEENLQRDTKAQLFDKSGVIPQATAPAWASELERDWRAMLDLSKNDPPLKKLLTAVPEVYISASSLASPSQLRHSFQPVEKAIREATFLPPGEEFEVETNPAAAIYAKAFAALTIREGQALRPATTDMDRLNNATFYLQKERNLAAAINELEQLKSPKAIAEAQEWLQQAKQRIQVEATVFRIRQNIQNTAKTYAKRHQ